MQWRVCCPADKSLLLRVNHCPCRPARWLILGSMHPGGSLDYNYYGPMPAACMAARIITICAIYQKKHFFTYTLWCGTARALAHYPRAQNWPCRRPWGLAKFHGRSPPGSGCAVPRTCTHKFPGFVARGVGAFVGLHSDLPRAASHACAYCVLATEQAALRACQVAVALKSPGTHHSGQVGPGPMRAATGCMPWAM